MVTPAETQDSDSTIVTGAHGQYHWLTSTEQYMGQFVQLCADVLLSRYLTVTSIDSGSPWLTDPQRAAGWSLRAGFAQSQRVSGIEELFFQRDGDSCPGYDEWYLFDAAPAHLREILNGNPFEQGNAPQAGRLLVFVNWGSFVLHDPDPVLQPITEMFWQQLDRVRPLAYIGDGRDSLTFVCRDKEMFKSVHRRLHMALKSAGPENRS